MSSIQIERENYVAEYSKNVANFPNHPLNQYQPKNFAFKGQGGQSKVLSFFSESRKKDLVVKIYPAVYYSDAKSEFNNMNMLEHPNILQVYEMHTTYVDGPKKAEKPSGENNSDSGSLNLESDSDKSEKEGEEEEELDDDMMLRQGAQYADILIIMEKADKTLSNVIFKRK